MSDNGISTVLEPTDEYPHEPDDGEELTTRITEAMTRYRCNGLTGVGMSEYLDQVVDGWPAGPDVPARMLTEEVGS